MAIHIWPFIIIVIIVFLIISEDGSQNFTKPCHHAPVNVTAEDNPVEALDKLIHNTGLPHTAVGWRRAMIVAIFATLLILFIFYPTFPDGILVFIIAAIIFTGLYFSSTWLQFNHWKKYDEIEEKMLTNLRNQITRK